MSNCHDWLLGVFFFLFFVFLVKMCWNCVYGTEYQVVDNKICTKESTVEKTKSEVRSGEHFILLTELRSALTSGMGSFRWT